jgi:hypothetical protein
MFEVFLDLTGDFWGSFEELFFKLLIMRWLFWKGWLDEASSNQTNRGLMSASVIMRHALQPSVALPVPQPTHAYSNSPYT